MYQIKSSVEQVNNYKLIFESTAGARGEEGGGNPDIGLQPGLIAGEIEWERINKSAFSVFSVMGEADGAVEKTGSAGLGNTWLDPYSL